MNKNRFVYFLLLCLVLLSACKQSVSGNGEDVVYFCGAENATILESGEQVFQSEEMVFKSAELQTEEVAFDGKYSVKHDSAHRYSMTFLLEDVSKGTFFQASVWQKETTSLGAIICAVTGETAFTITSNENGIYEHENGWMKLVLQFEAVSHLDSVKFFLFGGQHGEDAYFDNFQVKRFASRPVDERTTIDALSLYLPAPDKKSIDSIVDLAAKEEIIKEEWKEYVEGNLIYEGDSIPVEMRLKGDWTDHLISGNPSYRIKTNSGTAFQELRSFSIQHPKTRNYMHEWFMHQLCDQHDLLSTRYSFLKVAINEQYKGVYALEEHFDKQLLESRKRREGPILKLDETAFWALAVKVRELGIESPKMAFYESAIVSCFKVNRTLKSAALSAQFDNGAVLLNLYKNRFESPELLFDLKQIAWYYALMDLGNVRHSLAWHNRRFYYNPVTAKLEHIGFDMIPMVLPLNSLLASQVFKMDLANANPEDGLDHYLFLNPDFRKHYTDALIHISDEAYLNAVFANLDADISAFEEVMGQMCEGYQFERQMYVDKAKLIRNELKTLDARWDEFMANAGTENNKMTLKKRYEMQNSDFYLKSITVNAFRYKIDTSKYGVEFENFHFDQVDLLGYAVKANKDSIIPFDSLVSLKGYTGVDLPDRYKLVLHEKPSRFFFQPKNVTDKVIRKKFIKWKRPGNDHPRISLHQNFKRNTAWYQTKTDNKLIFHKGKHVIDELLYIPEGITVLIEEGTHIDFIQGGGLITNDVTHFNGTSVAPIQFISSDASGMGVTILNADSVLVAHVEVENMNTLDYQGWTLTGAFTIYESPCTINYLTIRGNQCEDGLNVIRSDFNIHNCLIEDTYSDGFDADFCTGTFSNSVFNRTGNDCIDFSGSVVQISDIVITESGDKGVSAGEGSTLQLSNIEINGALTGLASKDHSMVEGENISVKNAEIGIASFQKKPEYAPSNLNLTNVTVSNIGQLGLIEKGSEATINGKTYSGYQKFDMELMYARFTKK